ncbi:MAG: HEPN domain-containing protein [Calothrix sp. MO_192.B10]|nr:HEPN domain-containing protein [Calothrix sp. MO_192.B10]
MKFNWLEYYDLAKELADDTSAINCENSANNPKSQISEAKLRSSISRAYYAAFCLARNYLRDVLHDPRLSKARSGDTNEHQYVADEFKNYNKGKNKKMTEIGNDLARLRQLRNKADYDDTIFNLKKEAKLALKYASYIINKLDELNQENTK